MSPAADLPDDPATLKAMLVAAQGEIAQLKAVNALRRGEDGAPDRALEGA